MPFGFLPFKFGPSASPQEVKQRAKQMIAGLLEGTVANTSEAPGWYRPAIIDQPGALASVVKALTSGGKGFSGDTAAERYANNALRRAQLGAQRTNRTLGVNDPKDTRELALRVAGGFMLPGAPKGATAARAVSALPKGAKAVDAARKVAQATPKLVKVPLKAAIETVVPLRQASPKIAVPVAAGITGLLDVVMDKTVDPSTGQKYESTFGPLLGIEGLETTPAPEEQEQETDPVWGELETLASGTAVEVGDMTPEEADPLLQLDVEGQHPLNEDDVERAKQEDKVFGYKEAALAVAAVFAGYGATRFARSHISGVSKAATVADELPRFVGKKYGRSAKSKLGQRVVTQLFRQDTPIVNMAEEHLGRRWAKQWGYKSDLTVNNSIGSRVQNLFVTGAAPKTNLKTIKLAPLAQAWAKELDPQEQRLVSDALVAASALDDYKFEGVLSALNKSRFGEDVTPARLEALVQAVTSNPKYAKYYNAVQKSYDDMARYNVLRGLDTEEGYQRLRGRRPNYVAMNKNFETDAPFSLMSQRQSANVDQGLGSARGVGEGMGVQGETGVGDPFLALFDEWAHTIHRAEVNDVRALFLRNMDASGALNADGKQIIKAIPPDSKGDNVHVVRIDGKRVGFRVLDPEVNRALHYMPRASVKALETLRQAKQNMTTGPLGSLSNLFMFTAGPIYESMAASALHAKGIRAGIANRLFIGGHTGALRMIWDDTKRMIGTHLRDSMIRDHSALKDMLGPQRLDQLATFFENSFENSIKAEMERGGMISHTMWGSPDASQLLTGVEKVAPSFARSSAQLLQQDIVEAARAGELTPLRAAIESTKSGFAIANASQLARVMSTLAEAFNNGARYTAYAANRKRNIPVVELASHIRRISSDPSQHGAADLFNAAIGSNMYGPIAVQTLYQYGVRLREAPVTTFTNMMTTGMTAAAMLYTSLAYDPDAYYRHMKKSPQQKAISLSLFGGVELKLDPPMRLLLGTILPLYDHISGLTSGQFDPNFLRVMENFVTQGSEKLDEEVAMDWQKRTAQGLQDNSPFWLDTFPLVSTGLAAAGLDPAMSRMTGEAVLVKEQGLTGLESGTARPEALTSAWMENFIASTFSTFGRSLLQVSDEAARMYGEKHDTNAAIDAGVNKWRDNAARGAGPLRPILFGKYEAVESIADNNFQLMKDREKGIETAVKVLRKDIKGAGVTALSDTAMYLPADAEAVVPPELKGTEIELIATMANELENKWLRHYRAQLSGYGSQVEYKRNEVTTPIEQRNKDINRINEERRYQRMMMLVKTREYEEAISNRIGRPFRFDTFSQEAHIKPLGTTQ